MSIQPCEKPVIIKDVATPEQVAYAWSKIARKDLKEAFGITGNLMVFTERERKRRPVIPDNGSDTYSLEFGTTYSIDGDRGYFCYYFLIFCFKTAATDIQRKFYFIRQIMCRYSCRCILGRGRANKG